MRRWNYRHCIEKMVLGLILLIFIISIAGSIAQSAEKWMLAIEPRKWSFPRDHGSHREYRTEWWYFTGNLKGENNSRYGYQLTFFRHGVRFTPDDPSNHWSVRDIYPAHLTLTDVSSGIFRFDERISRAGPGLAGGETSGLDVWVLNWFAKMKGNTIQLCARTNEIELDLQLVPNKPVVIHGLNGLSHKGPSRGQASYYSSFTDLGTSGLIRSGMGGQKKEVKGGSWFDHEFGSNQLSSNQTGWDWFSLRLSDGQDIMIYLLRLKDGSIEPTSSGTLVAPDGTARHLNLSDLKVDVLDHWRSPTSRALYPSRWHILVPREKLDLTITPLLSNQELNTKESTGIIYWEGAVAGQGFSGEKPISCEGYVELTGYAGTLGEVF